MAAGLYEAPGQSQLLFQHVIQSRLNRLLGGQCWENNQILVERYWLKPAITTLQRQHINTSVMNQVG